MLLSPKIISPIQKPQSRPWIPYAQTKDNPIEHLIIVMNNVKTVHNPISMCLHKTNHIRKSRVKIKIGLEKLPFTRETKRLKLHRFTTDKSPH